MSSRDESASHLEDCDECGTKVKFDEGRFCPNCGAQPLLTVGGRDIGKTIIRKMLLISFPLAMLSFIALLADAPSYQGGPPRFTSEKGGLTVLISLLIFTIAFSIPVGIILLVAVIQGQMRNNLKLGKATDRHAIRTAIVTRGGFFGAAALNIINVLVHGLTGMGFLQGLVLGGIGGGVGAIVGYLMGLLVVPVARKEAAPPKATA